jgi:hypothetical protein
MRFLRLLFRPIAWLLKVAAGSLVIFVGFSTFLGLLLGKFPYAIPETFFGIPIPYIGGATGELQTDGLALIFIRIAVVTVALTIIIGVLNLLVVHMVRFRKRDSSITARLNSLALLGAFVAAMIASLAQRQEISDFLLENVQVPIESALAGLLFFSLVYGAIRFLRNRVTPAGLLFVLTVQIVLIGALPIAGLGLLAQVTDWLMQIPVTAGARGILLGIALATLVTGLRVLIGQDRTYGE